MQVAVFTLLGVVLGGLLTGATTLLLTRRTERREALVGANAVKEDLDEARKRLEVLERRVQARQTHESEQHDNTLPAVWWEPERALFTGAWELHHRALISQLPLSSTNDVQQAIGGVRRLNDYAALYSRGYRADDARLEADRRSEIDARGRRRDHAPIEVSEDDDFKLWREKQSPSLEVRDRDYKELIRPVLRDVRTASQRLQSYLNRPWWSRNSDALAFIALIVAVIAATGLWLQRSEPVNAKQVAQSMEVAFPGTEVSCWKRVAQPDTFLCVSAYGSRTACDAARSDQPSRALAVNEAHFTRAASCPTTPYGGGASAAQVLMFESQREAIVDEIAATPERLKAEKDPAFKEKDPRYIQGMIAKLKGKVTRIPIFKHPPHTATSVG